jgi:uncharacterized protein (DUF2141 family)
MKHNTIFFLALALTPASVAAAGELTVAVTGAAAPKTQTGGKGEVGCALYRSEEGFPMDSTKAAQRVWLPAVGEVVECRFADVPPGPFAVAVSVDLNGNRKTDKNFLGIPTEPWGVSGNVRPAMRAPRFAEAKGMMTAENLRIEVKVSK